MVLKPAVTSLLSIASLALACMSPLFAASCIDAKTAATIGLGALHGACDALIAAKDDLENEELVDACLVERVVGTPIEREITKRYLTKTAKKATLRAKAMRLANDGGAP